MRKIAATKQMNLEEKPYNICLDCPYLGESCDGPNFLGMTYKRWVEWCSERKRMLVLTNAEIADMAGIGKSTVDNIFSGRGEDTRMSTMQAITKVMVGGCWGQYPCHYASIHLTGAESPEIKINALQDELGQMRERLKAAERDARELEELRQQIKESRQRREAAVSEAKEDAQKKIDYLKAQIDVKDRSALDANATMRRRDRTVRTLSIIVGILGAALLALFVIDAFVPTVGWFRY